LVESKSEICFRFLLHFRQILLPFRLVDDAHLSDERWRLVLVEVADRVILLDRVRFE
jgi:hypothetical protein